MEEKNFEKITDIFKDAKDIKDVNDDMKKIYFATVNPNIDYKKKIVKDTYDSYYWMYGAIALLPSTEKKSDVQMSEIDYQYILNTQYQFLDLYRRGNAIKFVAKQGG